MPLCLIVPDPKSKIKYKKIRLIFLILSYQVFGTPIDQSCSFSKETIDLTVTRGKNHNQIRSKVPILLNFVGPKRPSGNC